MERAAAEALRQHAQRLGAASDAVLEYGRGLRDTSPRARLWRAGPLPPVRPAVSAYRAALTARYRPPGA